MANPQNPTSLVGYLGKDRIERYTEATTRTVWIPDPILDGELVEREVTAPARPYLKLSLATRQGGETRWHDLVVWNPRQSSGVHPAYLGRKGDQVRVTGRFEDYEFRVADGHVVSGTHFVVDSFSLVRTKAPEIP
jgi:single-stranded DNA-binding protein